MGTLVPLLLEPISPQVLGTKLSPSNVWGPDPEKLTFCHPAVSSPHAPSYEVAQHLVC